VSWLFHVRRAIARCLLVAVVAPALLAQNAAQGPPLPPGYLASNQLPLPPLAPSGMQLPMPQLNLTVGGGNLEPGGVSSAVEIVLLMTLLTMAPAIVVTLTSFTRIVIVLSFLRRAMTIEELPPNLVITGLSFFMTLFLMRPILNELDQSVLTPYRQETITLGQAGERAAAVMTGFMLKQTREQDLALMYELANEPLPQTPQEVPFLLVVPAFALSEVKTAFEMGFVILLPFLIIDLVISSILISMGMFMLPPPVISTPCKLLLFVLVDGWNLVIRSAAHSFVTP
jgi:flagellar biosynthetic protein FliP